MPEDIPVIKRDASGQEVWRYHGVVLEREPDSIRISAAFNRDDTPFHGVLLKRGDRFIETYSSEHWYNIDEIHDRDTGQLKCWYCNVARPAEIRDGSILYDDLALDLLIFPDGRQLVLDEDEFAALQLSQDDVHRARQALQELQRLFSQETKA